MAKVKVFKFEVLDPYTAEPTVSRRMATREGAAKIPGSRVIEGTEIEIDESQLEKGYPWTPMDFTP
jgi:hypothetical protein